MVEEAQAVEVYPNPSQGLYTLRIAGITGDAVAKVYSMTGQLVQQIAVAEGTQQIPLNLNDVAEGIYLLRFESASFVKEVKVIKN